MNRASKCICYAGAAGMLILGGWELSMFDKFKIYAPSQPSYPDTVHVHEHRQSTSEDARLLSDLEKEAWNKIINSAVIGVEDNVLNGVIFEIQKNYINQKTKFIMLFTLNGVKHEVLGESKSECISAALKDVTNQIMKHIMCSQKSVEAMQRAFPKNV